VSDFLEYLKKSRGEGSHHQKFMTARRGGLDEAQEQLIKNSEAPIISGSSAANSNDDLVYRGGQTKEQVIQSAANSASTFKKGTNVQAVPMNLSKKKVRPTAGRVTQGYGGNKPNYAAGRHTGVDFGGKIGDAIKAAASGTVTFAGSYGSYGNAIKIKQVDGTTALYAHLSGYNVKAGQTVSAGTKIGKLGNTGNSTGPHLHFEVRGRDQYGGDINASSWLSK